MAIAAEAEIEPEELSTPAATGRVRIVPREWLLLFVLAAVQFTHIVDFMIIMPLGPVYMREMSLVPSEFGHVLAAYTISAGIASLAASRLLDRFDRKSALLVLYGGFAFGTFLCAIATNYAFLLTARIVAGAFGGVAAAVVLAIVGDVFADARRGTAMGVVMTAFSIASIAGMPAGLALVDAFGWQAPFIALTATSGLVLIMAAFALPKLRGHLAHGPASSVSTWNLVSDANHLRAFGLTAALYFGTSTVIPFLATYLTVITRRVVVQQLLKRKSVGRLDAAAGQAAYDGAANGHNSISNRDEVARLLEELEGTEAQVVRMYHLEGKSYQEISSLVGMPENSIGPTLSRAREKMRRAAVE
jgi:MFS family permease